MIKFILISIVLILCGVLYSLYKFDVGKKNYDVVAKCFPSFLVWPKDRYKYDKLWKIIVILFLAVFVILLIVF